MGAPAKKDGKAVEGVDIFLGGAVGEGTSPIFRTSIEWTCPLLLTVFGGQDSPTYPASSALTHRRLLCLFVATEAELGEKHLTNVAMGNEDEDVIEALGKILVEKFNAKPKVSA